MKCQTKFHLIKPPNIILEYRAHLNWTRQCICSSSAPFVFLERGFSFLLWVCSCVSLGEWTREISLLLSYFRVLAFIWLRRVGYLVGLHHTRNSLEYQNPTSKQSSQDTVLVKLLAKHNTYMYTQLDNILSQQANGRAYIIRVRDFNDHTYGMNYIPIRFRADIVGYPRP